MAVRAAESRREEPGKQGRNQAVEVGNAGAEGDQGEHVETAMDQGVPGPLEEDRQPPQRTTGVARSSSIQGAAPAGSSCFSGSPGMRSPMARRKTGTVSARQTQNRRVMACSSGFSLLGADHFRFEIHAADRAGTGSLLDNLGVHRAGILPALTTIPGPLFFRRFRLFRPLPQGRRRVGGELLPAVGRAEIVRLSMPLCSCGSVVRIYLHTADGILHRGSFLCETIKISQHLQPGSMRWMGVSALEIGESRITTNQSFPQTIPKFFMFNFSTLLMTQNFRTTKLLNILQKRYANGHTRAPDWTDSCPFLIIPTATAPGWRSGPETALPSGILGACAEPFFPFVCVSCCRFVPQPRVLASNTTCAWFSIRRTDGSPPVTG